MHGKWSIAACSMFLSFALTFVGMAILGIVWGMILGAGDEFVGFLVIGYFLYGATRGILLGGLAMIVAVLVNGSIQRRVGVATIVAMVNLVLLVILEHKFLLGSG